MAKLKLGKSAHSRTRAKSKVPVLTEDAFRLIEESGSNDSFTRYLLRKGHSKSTITRYLWDVGRFTLWLQQEHIQLDQVSYTDVLSYIQSFRNRIKQGTITGYINSLKNYFDHLTSSGLIAENPVRQINIKGVKRKALHHILSGSLLDSIYSNYPPPQELKRQNWTIERPLIKSRNKTILGLLIYQGLSTTDIIRLKLTDVSLTEGTVYIASTRRSNERKLSLKAVQMLDLMQYIMTTRKELLAIYPKDTSNLFVTAGTDHKLNNTLRLIASELRGQFTEFTNFNQLRASVITHWLKSYNLREVQYMAGHRYISSTEGYLVNDLEGMHENISKYHPIE